MSLSIDKYIRLASFLILSLFICKVNSQELCDDGIDNDGDGLVDCYDSDCSSSPKCDDFFFGNSIICFNNDVNPINLKKQWVSKIGSSTSHASPAIGDINKDGIPEVVTINNISRKLYVIEGHSGKIITSIQLGFEPSNTPLIGDTNNNGKAEIFVSENNGDHFALYSLGEDNNLHQVWNGKSSSNQSIGIPGIANFDQDPDNEIYYRNEIIEASTGKILIKGTDNWAESWANSPVAVDLLPDDYCESCKGLELITGNEIWSIDEASASMEQVKDLNDVIASSIDPQLEYFPTNNNNSSGGSVSVADYNSDGSLDILLSGILGNNTESNGETTIFMWDILNDNVLTFNDVLEDPLQGSGRIVIADLNNNGFSNAVFAMGQKLYALNQNFEIYWEYPISNLTNSYNSPTIFDLNGDDKSEVLFRDQSNLLIIDGYGNGDKTTSLISSEICKSITQEESIVVVDVDGDGSSEICVACLADNNMSLDPYGNTEFSHIRVYESENVGWKPSRRVWNQYSFFNVNINDDLTIPKEIQDHSAVFSIGACSLFAGSSINYPIAPLNAFGTQTTFLNENGCKESVSADLDIYTKPITATDIGCVIGESEISYTIHNVGDLSIYIDSLYTSFYFGHPENDQSILLSTKVISIGNLELDQFIEVDEFVSGIPSEGEIYLVINDKGTIPNPSFSLRSTILECENENNIRSINVNYSIAPNQIEYSICEGDFLEFGDQILTDAGVYNENFGTEDAKCQTVNLTLNIIPNTEEELSRSICQGQSFEFGNQVLDEAGNYTEIFKSSTGCDSLVNLQLTVLPIASQISIQDGILSVNETENATYQWIDCINHLPIAGEKNRYFTPKSSGSYSVKILTPECVIDSKCFEHFILDFPIEETIKIFPIPAGNNLKIEFSKVTTGFYYIYDLSGSKIKSSSIDSERNLVIDLNNIVSGFYIIEIMNDDGTRMKFKIPKK